ncbi:MAG: molybdopterin molybdotransferase MoeA [Nitrospirota bacterium]|nr:molybdopterin molybdotransferase MoeA [Nitrospirota bacterium]
MISVDDALKTILAGVPVLGTEKVHIIDTLGRVIAEDVISGRNIPPFDNSAMDGYALKAADTTGASPEKPATLKVVADLPAGYTLDRELQAGEAVRIMTGAPVPPGADSVVRVEDTEKRGETVRILVQVKSGKDTRRKGEDVKVGDVVIEKGTRITPAAVGMMSSVGRSMVQVYQRPRVAVLATGDEVVDVDQEAGPGKIYNSNGYTIASQVREAGGLPVMLGIAKDTREDLEAKLKAGLTCDVIISSGGVSVGDFDFVKDVLSSLGSEMKFWKVGMRPGKPLAFGVIGGKPAFGLPGNPVSSMVTFEQFVRPALRKMMGYAALQRPTVNAVLEDDVKKEPSLRFFVRGVVSRVDGKYRVSTTGPQGSGILRSMVIANGLIVLPEGTEGAKAGDTVRVQLFNREFEEE